MSDPTHQLTLDDLESIAPRHPTSYRQLRYSGDAMGVALSAFTPADQELIRRLYTSIGDLQALLKQGEHDPEGTLAALPARCAALGWSALMSELRGLTLAPEHGGPRASQVLHDLKGGALQALAVYTQFAAQGLAQPGEVSRMFFLARDQLKIMRNCVDGLDPEGSARDNASRDHAVELLIEKWANARHHLGEAPAQIALHSTYSGPIAERCLEFAALDRVIYNLINNATRHSADGRVDLWITQAGPADLRFAVANRVTPEQRHAVEARFPAGPGELFQGGFTTGGSGLGLRICADFICNAYGLPSVDHALEHGHLGAAFHAGHFIAWVHWPIAGD